MQKARGMAAALCGLAAACAPVGAGDPPPNGSAEACGAAAWRAVIAGEIAAKKKMKFPDAVRFGDSATAHDVHASQCRLIVFGAGHGENQLGGRTPFEWAAVVQFESGGEAYVVSASVFEAGTLRLPALTPAPKAAPDESDSEAADRMETPAPWGVPDSPGLSAADERSHG